MTADADGSNLKLQLEARTPNFIANQTLLWSKESDQIFFVGAWTDQLPSLFKTVVNSGEKNAVSTDSWGDIAGLAFGSDGDELLLSGAHSSTNYFYQIWAMPVSGGPARRVTNDPNNYMGLSGSADLKSFVTIQNDRVSDIWMIPGNTANGVGVARQVTYERYDGRGGLSWTPDGKIVFANRNFDLWLMDADGANRKLLTTEEHSNRNPYVTPDGKYILFQSWRKSSRGQTCGLWIMTIDGTDPRFLAATQCSSVATCTGDCQSVLFDAHASAPGIWKVPIRGGDSVQVIKEETLRPVFSPDGTRIACILFNRSVSAKPQIAIYSAEGGSPQKVIQTIPVPELLRLHWTADGKAIAYVSAEAGAFNLWLQPVDGGPAKQITNFDSHQILSFDWFKDGRIAVARGQNQNDVMFITRE